MNSVIRIAGAELQGCRNYHVAAAAARVGARGLDHLRHPGEAAPFSRRLISIFDHNILVSQ